VQPSSTSAAVVTNCSVSEIGERRRNATVIAANIKSGSNHAAQPNAVASVSAKAPPMGPMTFAPLASREYVYSDKLHSTPMAKHRMPKISCRRPSLESMRPIRRVMT